MFHRNVILLIDSNASPSIQMKAQKYILISQYQNDIGFRVWISDDNEMAKFNQSIKDKRETDCKWIKSTDWKQ